MNVLEYERAKVNGILDITYIATDERWLYLAGVLDLCSRRIVGWSIADHMRSPLVSDALEMAIARRDPEAGLLHDSDRGVQYASEGYQHLLQQHQMHVSMSGKGDCWDNACVKSFGAPSKENWSARSTTLPGKRLANRSLSTSRCFTIASGCTVR